MTAAIAVSPPQPARQSIRFRARSFIAFALAPELPIVDWLAELDAWTKTSPGFFLGRPVILDLAATSLSASGITHLLSELAERGVRIMGLENAEPDQLGTSLPPLLKGGRPAATESASEPRSPAAAASIEPVREEPSSLVLTATLSWSVQLPRAPKWLPAARSISMARCGGGRWRAPPESQGPASFAEKMKPSFLRSTVTTRPPRT